MCKRSRFICNVKASHVEMFTCGNVYMPYIFHMSNDMKFSQGLCRLINVGKITFWFCYVRMVSLKTGFSLFHVLQVNLVRTEMSTARSKYLRELDEARDKLDRALSSNDRDQSMRDKILNDAKIEILTLSNKVSQLLFYFPSLE